MLQRGGYQTFNEQAAAAKEAAMASRAALDNKSKELAAASASRKARQTAKAPPMSAEQKESALRAAREEAEAAEAVFQRWAAKDHAQVERAQAEKVKDAERRAAERAAARAAPSGAGIFGLEALLAPPAADGSVPEDAAARAEELAALQQQLYTADKKVRALRATGGVMLAEANEEKQALKTQVRTLEAKVRRANRAAEQAGGAAVGAPASRGEKKGVAPVPSSAAALHSARRLERQRARAEAREGGAATTAATGAEVSAPTVR